MDTASLLKRRRSEHSKYWIYSDKELNNPCTCNTSGVSLKDENIYRIQAIGHMQQVGKYYGSRNNMHAGMVASAAMFLHRFYMHHSFLDISHLAMSTCCLYVATKADMKPKTKRLALEDLILCSITSAHGQNHKPDAEYLAELRKDVFYHERLLLATLGFNMLDVRVPLDFVAEYVCSIVKKEELQIRVITDACKLLNSILGGVFGLRYHPEVMACCAVKRALHNHKVEVDSSWYNNVVENPEFLPPAEGRNELGEQIKRLDREVEEYIKEQSAWLRDQQRHAENKQSRSRDHRRNERSSSDRPSSRLSSSSSDRSKARHSEPTRQQPRRRSTDKRPEYNTSGRR
eukprot:m.16073 g.16073  ORF g.16073 m.16073 type:complete len:345 (-) comp5579_c0_seq2:116-1150(-)